MNAGTNAPGKVTVAPRRPRSSFVFGEEILLAPKLEFEISIDENEEASRLAASHIRNAQSSARIVLVDIATDNEARAQRFPNSSTAWIQAGLAHLAAAHHEEAEKAFKRALDIDPTSRNARLGVARVANEIGDPHRSLQILRILQSEAPEDLEVVVAIAVVIANMEGAHAALEILDFEPANDRHAPAFFAARGSLRVATKNYKRAISDLRKVVRLRPEWVQARNVLGVAELKAGYVAAAERRFRESVRIAPMYLEGYLNLLRVLMRQQRYRDVLELSLDRFPDVAAAPAPVGRIASQAGFELEEWTEARIWLESALGKTDDPFSRARLLNDLGVTYSRVGRHAEAEKRFAAAVDAMPLELSIINRAKSLLTLEGPLVAAGWLRSAPVPEGSFTVDRRRILAVALHNARLFQDAAGVYEGLIADGVADRMTFATLSALYVDNLADAERGVRVARRGVSEFPGDALVVNNLAYALLMAGLIDDAGQVLDMASEPTDVEAVALTATKGLLALRRGQISAGRKLYNEALALAANDALRERVRAKRNLEVARALIRSGATDAETIEMLKAASQASDAAYPYQLHAQAELLRLR